MQIDLENPSIQKVPFVVVRDNDGQIVNQKLTEFLYGASDLKITCMLHGQALFDILYDDHGFIRYDDNKLALSFLLENDFNGTVMRIMGRVCESVIVRRCKQYAPLNLLWLRIELRFIFYKNLHRLEAIACK